MISVIIAAYNAEKYLPECLDSVLGQSYKDLEVLVVNDGSSDSTPAIIDEYSRKDPRVIPIHQENKGVSGARNAAFARMKGEYFTIMDSDDLIDSNAYEEAVRAAESNDADMVVWGFERFSEKGTVPQPDPMLRQGLYEGKECKKLWLDFVYREKRRIFPFLHCRMMRTSVMKDHGLKLNEKLKRSEDFMLLCEFHFFCNKVYSMTDQKFLHYRMNEESITHKYVEDYFGMVRIIYDDLKTFARENKAYSEEFAKRNDRMCLYRTFMAIENENLHRVSDKEKRQNVRSFLRDPLVKGAAGRIGFGDGKKLFGKKYYAMRLGLASMLLKFCKG